MKLEMDFNPNAYGYKKLSELAGAIGLFEIDRVDKRIFIRDGKEKRRYCRDEEGRCRLIIGTFAETFRDATGLRWRVLAFGGDGCFRLKAYIYPCQ